jgi:hypothetical protein
MCKGRVPIDGSCIDQNVRAGLSRKKLQISWRKISGPMDSRPSTHPTAALLLPRDQPLKTRVAPERGEGGIDLKPAGREVVGHPEQWLKLSKCAFLIAE